MSRLQPTKDSRTTYDEKTGAVRSFFGAELVAPVPEAKRSLAPVAKSDDFLEVNRGLFHLENISLRKDDMKEGSASQSMRYGQQHRGIPVYGAQLVIGLRKQDGAVTSAVNKIDYEIPDVLRPENARLNADDVIARMRQSFSKRFEGVEIITPELFIYRYAPPEIVQLPYEAPPIRNEMLSLSSGLGGQVYLVWQVLMDTKNPDGNWELLVDATNGELVTVKDRRRYATRKGNVFYPDPIRSSQNDNMSWNTQESTLNNEQEEVDLENLNNPVNNKYKLNGSWVNMVEKESPTYAPPETTGDFKYGSKERSFLNVMAYYYLDRLVTYLRSLGATAYNNAVTGPLDVDPQGFLSADNSQFVDTSPPYIAYGEGGVPDASDPGVIVHEYGHALHYYLLPSNTPNSSYEEGFNDFLAACWLDHFNDHQFQREEVMPWDQHYSGTSHWGPTRRVDLTQRFDDGAFPGYDFYFKGNVHATALWDIFLNIGGNSPNANVRKAAADVAIRTYLEMLITVQDNEPPATLAKGLITADVNLTGGLYKKVIWDAFRRRGLWADFTPIGNVDLYIRDSDTDTGEHASPQIHWTSPDIWVRNNPPTDPGENPDDGHQPPINNVPNYLYVLVHNRGSQDAAANTFSVEAFHCNPATAMLWPTHFQSMGTLPITTTVLANGSSVRIGPFLWTPQIVDHECLLAVVKGSADQTIADDVKAMGAVDHWKLVRFDNNVGQRNVEPKGSTPGGKTKTSFLVRGTTHPSINTLRLDASALPPDTKIAVRVTRSITDHAASIFGLVLINQNERWSTMKLVGGAVGKVVGFPLGSNEEKSVSLEIDFSYQAEHLKRYPIIAGQEQDGVLAGQLTIEITAVKESEDYVYGNVRSRELHTLNCVFRKAMSPRNQMPFQTIKDALARGYNGCRYCLPEYSSD
ncbi:MAG: M36 family metallopeptidase [Methanothrix sp.]|nr:M36 family metallopeptidase [Methanothrix sp.]